MVDNLLVSKVREEYASLTKKLVEKHLTITTMESCTSGLIASLITDTEGASAAIKGAFITYSNEAKVMEGVPLKVIDKFGVYSRETAASMAQAAKEKLLADISIGVTGSFGNVDPSNKDSVPGKVYFAIVFKENCYDFFISIPTLKSRSDYKLYVAQKVFEELDKLL